MIISAKDLIMLKKTKGAMDEAKREGLFPMSNLQDMLETWKDSSHCFDLMHCSEELEIFNKNFIDTIDVPLYRGIAIMKNDYEKYKDNNEELLKYLNSYHKEGINTYCSTSKSKYIANKFTRYIDTSCGEIAVVIKVEGASYFDIGYNEVIGDDEQEVIVKNPIYIAIETIEEIKEEDYL